MLPTLLVTVLLAVRVAGRDVIAAADLYGSASLAANSTSICRVGRVRFVQTGQTVNITWTINVSLLPSIKSGPHGFHVHAIGSIDGVSGCARMRHKCVGLRSRRRTFQSVRRNAR
jgi:Cu/Zn superoxide dismutase